MKKKIMLSMMVAVLSSPIFAGSIKVVTTLQDLKSITEMIGGNRVEVFSIATGYQNPHFVDPKPSYIIKLSTADLFVTIGLDLEAGWSPSLLASSRNPKIQKGNPGYVDASTGVTLMQVPSVINRAEGDIHIYGNPHYWLDPVNGKTIAQNIYDGLVRVSPENKDYFAANLKTFNDKLESKLKEWSAKMQPYKGTRIIAYHNEWCYFENRFGLKIVDFLEPKPGIPPAPSQLVKIIGEVKSEHIKVIISSPYFSTASSEVVTRETGARSLVLATSTGAFESVKSYFDVFDYNIRLLLDALK
jgi:zinc/manganese transport system substrate-binding protein